MFEQKRVMNEFEYVPFNDRSSKYDPITPLPPRKGGDRKATFWLAAGENESNLITNIYFINSSDEILNQVIYSTSGMQTIDDEVSSSASKELSYRDVLPGEAVKIDEYDAFYDSDILVAYYVTVVSDKVGRVDYSTLTSKQCIHEAVLQWEDGEIA
ncbi:MAG: hypothetical protein IME94_10460 [Proteobacteria bacterium]|nr:hypothetical protein [Pseudomonadota bacterium]